MVPMHKRRLISFFHALKLIFLIERIKQTRFRWVAIYFVMPVLSLLCLNTVVHAVDLLEGGKETVNDTFGADSSIAIWIIIGEVIFGVISYIRSKNIFLLFGVAIVVVFTSIGFGLAG